MRPEARLPALAVLLLAGLLLALPWLQGGRAPAAQAAAVLLLAAPAAGLAWTGRSLLRPSPLLGLGGILAAVSAAQSLYPDRTAQALLLLVAYTLAAALAAHAARALRWGESALLAALAASGLAVAVAGALTVARGTDPGLYGRLLAGPFGYPNAAAGFLLAAAGAAVALAASPAPWLRAAAGTAAALLLIGVGLTHSRSAMLAAAAGALAYALLPAGRRRRGWPAWGFAAAALLLGAGVAAALARELLPALAAGTADSSAGWRLHILRWTWQLVRAHPWAGVGPGAYPVALKHVQALPYVSGENPHNLYLEIAAEYGLPAALLAAALLVAFLLRLGGATRGPRAAGPASRRLGILAAALAALAVHAGMDMLTSFPAIPLAAAALGGLAAARGGAVRLARRRASRAWRAAVVVLLALAAGVALGRYLAVTQVELGRLALAHGRGAEAAADFRRALLFNPLSFGGHRGLIQASLATGREAEAIALARRAARLAPQDPDTQYLAGETFAAAGDWPAAASRFRAALDLAPASRLRYYGAMMDALVQAGQAAEARWWFERAAQLFTRERLDGEGRCLEPGDRYLLAHLARRAARLYAEAGDAAGQANAAALAQDLRRPPAKGICASAGQPGRTSPEAAVVSFWRALTDAGWPAAQRLMLPEAPPIAAPPRLRGEVLWIASLAGNEHRATLHYAVARDGAPSEAASATGGPGVGDRGSIRLERSGPESRAIPATACFRTAARFTTEGWALEHVPVAAPHGCQAE